MRPPSSDPLSDPLSDLVLGAVCLVCARPGRVLCPACADALPRRAVRVESSSEHPDLAPAYAAGWYAPPLRPVLLAHKERRAWALTGVLGEVLAGVVADVVAGAVPCPGPELLLVPVPSRPAVVRRRGHDPVARTARVAARLLTAAGTPATAAPLLRQRLPVADQAGLGATARAANLAGRLQVRSSVLRRLARRGVPVRVVLCDDVLTTGATAREAQRALETVGVPVAAVAVLAATRRRSPGPNPWDLP